MIGWWSGKTNKQAAILFGVFCLAAAPAFGQTQSTADVEIRAGECSIGTGTSDARTRDGCTWNAPTPFDLTWTAEEVRLTVGGTTIRRAATWRIDTALRVLAVGRARVTIATEGGRKVGKFVSGRLTSSEPVEFAITRRQKQSGWTITGTVERLGGGSADDAVLMSIDQPGLPGRPDNSPLDQQRPWTTSAGVAGPYNLPSLSVPRSTRSGYTRVSLTTSASRTWTGAASANWSDPNNWSPPGPPVSGDALAFTNTGANRTMNNDINGLAVGSVTVQDNNYTIGGLGLTLQSGQTSSIGRDFTVTSLAGSGAIAFDNGKLLITQNGSTTFAGSFSGNNGQLIMQGQGTLTYRGSGSALSRLEVRSGLVVLDGGSLGPVYLEGGRFAITNNGNAASLTANNGQVGDPAAGTGRTGPFTFNNGTYLQSISSATSFAKLSVQGTVQFGGPSLTVQLLDGYIPALGTIFIIVDNDGGDGVVNRFQNLPEGAEVSAGSVRFTISYVAGTGNDIALTVTGTPAPADSPDLTIAKAQTGSFTAGQSGGTYALTVSNIGKAPSSGTVTVTDTLPAGFAATAVVATGWSCSTPGSVVTCSRGDALAPSAAYPAITIPVQLASSVPPATVTNTATVAGGGDTTPANNTATIQTTVSAGPAPVIDLAISKTAQQPFTRGGQATYALVVTNLSTSTGPSVGAVTVTDTVSTDLTSPTASGTGWSCTTSNQTVNCSRADTRAPGEAFPTITLTAAISATAASSVSNSAAVSGGGDTIPTNNSATITTPIGAPDLTIAKTHRDPFTQGQTGATFTLTVTNSGTGPTNGMVTVADTLPAGFTATGAAGSGWACATAQSMQCNRTDSLAAGASYPAITLTVNVATNASSTQNTATVSGGADTSAGNNTAIDPVTVTPAPGEPPDLTVTKRHTGQVVQGGTVTFEIVASVAGSTPTSGEIVVTDTLPADLTPVSASGGGWTCTVSAPAVTCRRSDAFVGPSTLPTISLVASVSATATIVENKVTVSGGGDVTPGNNSGIL